MDAIARSDAELARSRSRSAARPTAKQREALRADYGKKKGDPRVLDLLESLVRVELELAEALVRLEELEGRLTRTLTPAHQTG